LPWSYRKNPIYYMHRILINSSETHSDVVAGKWASKNDRIRWGRLISHIHENAVETEVHLIATISSMCVNIQKYPRYICAIMQWSLCVIFRITMKSQAASSTAFVNYSKKKILLKYTTIVRFEKCVKNDTTKFKMIFKLEFFKYLMLRGLGNPYITEITFSFVLSRRLL